MSTRPATAKEQDEQDVAACVLNFNEFKVQAVVFAPENS
jgi:hypothetical protein